MAELYYCNSFLLIYSIITRMDAFFLIIFIVLLAIYIIDYKRGLEHFKTELIYTPKYLNDPRNIIKYVGDKEIAESKRKIDSGNSVNRVQSNDIYSESIQKMTQKNKSNISDEVSEKLDTIDLNEYIEEVNIVKNPINNGDMYRGKNKQKVNFNPVIKQIDSKYKLYADSLFTPLPAPKLQTENNPIIDQTINTNIMNYANNGIQSIPIDYSLDKEEYNFDLQNINMKGKTIKEVYDEITNDSRMGLQQNLDNLQAFSLRNDYNLGEKYGATRFDTYALS